MAKVAHPVRPKSSNGGDDARMGSDLVAFMPMMKNYAWKFCRSPERAEDLAQNALLKAWAARASFTPGTSLKAWTFTILRNEIYSHFRRAVLESRWFCEWDDRKIETVSAPEALELGSLKFRDAMRGLNSAVSPTQRDAIIAVYMYDMPYEQVAALQSCPVGTAKSRVHRGLAQLRAWNEGLHA
jgi:RNA polymerase sigma-70 factor, ECF subfamily